MPHKDPEARRMYAREYYRKYRARHPEKTREAQRKHRQKHPEKLRAEGVEYRSANRDALKAARRLKEYGLTKEQHDALKAKAPGCHVCGVRFTDKGKHRECIDHCHETGRIRGLLCGACNAGLGLLGDNVEGLEKALRYLKGENP